jgi:hypothetical protein
LLYEKQTKDKVTARSPQGISFVSEHPDFHFEVSYAEIQAAIARKDYGWLVEHVFNPALAQFLRKKNTDTLINNPRPRARRPAGMRRHRNSRTRRISQVPG